MAVVRQLAGGFGSRHGTSSEFREAARWVGGYFERLGYRVERQAFDVPGGNSWGLDVPAGTSVNVVATPAGFDPRRPHLVVGAHLDTVPQAPGAEDNGSGIGVMLAAAAAAAESRTRLPVVWVAFGAEEPRGDGDDDHHYGSRAYVAGLTGAQRDAVRGMVSLDRVGVGTRVPVGSAHGSDPVQQALLSAARRTGTPTIADPFQRSSDHWSFVRAGLPGVRLGSTPYAAYHSAADVSSVVDPAQLERTGRILLGWLQPTATDDPGSPRRRGRPEPLTIAVAGDVHFEGVLRRRLDRPATALAPVTATLAAADVAIVNLETSLGAGGRPEPGKRYTFQAPLTALTALAAAGIDVATMANNHALDFGADPLASTFSAIRSARAADPPLAVVGIGRDVGEAFRPARIDVDGTVVATIGATVADNDPTADPTGHWAATRDSPGTADAVEPARLLRAVGEAARSADVVVVYMHWGVQGERCPNDAQRSLASDLIEAGGDLVVGSHTHLLQGDGRMGEGYVAYGLGNYAWYTQSAEATPATGVLTLTVQPAQAPQGRAKVTDASWEGAEIGADGLPTPLTGGAAAGFEDDVTALRGCADLTPVDR